MSSLTIDEKIHLLQKMRNQANVRSSLSKNMTSGSLTYEKNLHEDTTLEENQPIETHFFKYRVLICIGVFFACFASYKADFSIKGKNVQELSEVLEANLLPENIHNSLESVCTKIITSFHK